MVRSRLGWQARVDAFGSCGGSSNEADRYSQPRHLPSGRRLPVGLPGAYAGARIHPPDRFRSLRRCLYGELAQQRVSGNSRSNVRPALRTGLSARPGGGEQRQRTRGQARAGRDLPAQTRGRRSQRRRFGADAAASDAQERQAHRLRRRGAIGADGRARSRAARLPRHRVRGRSQSRAVSCAPRCRASDCPKR